MPKHIALATAMELRRSSRSGSNDSNGRDYLANRMGWPREQLEDWLKSGTLRPHLQLWHYICIGSPRRFNDAVDWINSGDNGYFYNSEHLESDLLVLCLDADSTDTITLGNNTKTYAHSKADTSGWITQELWARTAWRIVQSNKASGQAFEKWYESNAATCYGFAIELLCLSFHSIAYRGAASVYAHLIDGVSPVPKSIKPGTTPATAEHDDSTRPSSLTSDDESTDDSSNDGSLYTPESENDEIIQSSPATSLGSEDCDGILARRYSSNDTESVIMDKHSLKETSKSVPSKQLDDDSVLAGTSLTLQMNLGLIEEKDIAITDESRAF